MRAATTNTPFVIVTADGSLSDERVLTAGTGVTLVDGGPNTTLTVSIGQSVAVTASPTFAGLTLTGNLAMGANAITNLGGTVTGTYTLGGTPTLSGPTLSGTVSGTPTWASAQTFPGLTLSGNLAMGANAITNLGGTVTGTYTLGGTPTLSGPTLSGTIAGTPTWASAQTFPGLTLTGNLAMGANAITFTDATIVRGAAGRLDLHDGVNQVRLRVYGTRTDADNGEYLSLTADGTQALVVSGANGTGTVGFFEFGSGGNTWRVQTNGNLQPTANGSFDLGGTSNLVRSGYFGTSIVVPTLNVTTAYQFNGNALATTSSTPANPTGTTSTTGVMMGLAGSITTRTGRVLVIISGTMKSDTANDGAQVQIRYGTGTAPTNGAALTGTAVGSLQRLVASAVTSEEFPFSVSAVVTGLTGGTAYWLDVGLAAITGGTAAITSVSVAAHDTP